MSTTVITPPNTAEGRRIGLVRRVLLVAVTMIIAFAAVTAMNAYVVATSTGFNVAPRYSFIVTKQSATNANIFWGCVSAVAAAALIFGTRHGLVGLIHLVAARPGSIRASFRTPGQWLAAGAGAALGYAVAPATITAPVGIAALAAALLLAPADQISRWEHRVVRLFHRDTRSGFVAPALIGVGAGLLVAAVGARGSAAVIAAAIGAPAFYATRRAYGTGAAVLLLHVLAGVYFVTEIFEGRLSADDGTWTENSTFKSWWEDGGDQITEMSKEPGTWSAGTSGVVAAAGDTGGDMTLSSPIDDPDADPSSTDPADDGVAVETIDSILGPPPAGEPAGGTPGRPAITNEPLGRDPVKPPEGRPR